MKTRYFIVIFASALLFLLTCRLCTFTLSSSWIGSVTYFVLTYIALQRYDDEQHTIIITCCVVAGRLLAEIPLMVASYVNRVETLLVTVVTLAAIVLSATYWRNRTGVVLILSVVIMILLNTLGYDAWNELTAH